MKQYLDLLNHILNKGNYKTNRTGVNSYSIFGYQLQHNLNDGFPLLTTKKVFFKGVAHELLWFLKGDTNIKYLNDNGIHIWDMWANEKGDLGPVYGEQWIKWKTENGIINQIDNAINLIKNNPDSRRIIVTAWNPGEVERMALPPCHCFFQFNVFYGELSCLLYQRSADVFIGSPFNMASYALLTHMIAHVCDLNVGNFIYSLGDAHIYENQIEQSKLQITRQPKKLPTLKIKRKVECIYDFKYEDFEIIGYEPDEHIKAPVAK